MKALLVNKFHYLKGGSEKFYFTLADILKKNGWDVVFFSMKDKENNIPCQQENYFVNHSSVSGGIKSKLNMVLHIAYSNEAYKKMLKLLQKENPDVVILNVIHKQITCSVIDAIKKFNPKIPILWVVHDLIFICPSYSMLNGCGEICEECLHGDFSNCVKNKCIHGSRLMSLLSTFEANQIKKKGWYNKVDSFICPSNFYQSKLIEADFTNKRIDFLRNPLPAGTQYIPFAGYKKYFVYFGRLSPEKGILDLIKAMLGIKYVLKIVGTGPSENELKDYVLSNKIPNVTFVGFKKGIELQQIVSLSRAVVIPSKWYENCSYSGMEAMSYGKPLIVSNKGGLPEFVDNGKNGFIFSNQEELKSDLLQMIQLSDSEYKKMSQRSVSRAMTMFNADDYYKKLVSLIKEIKNEKT
jgi:glycosyltransferase involved in cell wall biosynthesis